MSTPAPGPEPAGRVLLIRHGRTSWAHTGRHTGRTDIALDEVGQAQARALPRLLADLVPSGPGGQPVGLVLVSPLQRAWATAELAGLSHLAQLTPEPDLQEWDYGGYEGLTSTQIRALRGDAWTIFRDGVVPGGPGQGPGQGAGESLAEVAARAEAVLARVRAALRGGDVVLVGHGHALRVLGAVWLGLDPRAGEQLLLDPASVCVLTTAKDEPSVQHWNLTPALFLH